MKFLQLLCLTGALGFTLNAGTVVFGNIGCSYTGSDPAACINESSAGSDPVDLAGPLYDSFTSSGVADGQIIDLQLILNGDNTSSGTLQVDLYTDNSGAPGTEIGVLATLSDSMLSSTPGLYDFTVTDSPLLAADTSYWIKLSGTTSTYWSYDSDHSGIGVGGQSYSNTNGIFSDAGGAYQMQVTESSELASTPEPASTLLIVTGAGVLALLRRRAVQH